MADDWHVLIVEDNAPLRERLARYLRGEGFAITTAAEGDGVVIQTCISAAAGPCDIDL